VFQELRPLIRLSIPVVLAEIGWMSMGIVDTLMVGPLGPAAIGATGMSSAVFTAIAIFGMGLMLGLDALVSQAFGARRVDECVRWLHQGIALAVVTAPVVMALTWVAFATVDWWGLHPDIRVLVARYLRVISVSAFPLLLYAALRRYLQGRHVVRPVMVALISANLVNAAANWVLIYGRLGMPALGVEGSAWATTIARIYMALFLLVAVYRVNSRDARHIRIPFTVDVARIRSLVSLGFPAASPITLEVGVFAAAP
jgi:multidrug resistance protein, MATE family